MKNKKTWTVWFAPRSSITGTAWADKWFKQLQSADLLGLDYILPGFNTRFDKWFHRRATYSDVANALQAILVTSCGLKFEEARQITPHSCRHFLVSPGRQLQLEGHVTSEGLESLGHWEHGSSMPIAYDSAAGVTEFSTRCKIVNALSAGWRPASTGEVAAIYTLDSKLDKAPKWNISKAALASAPHRKKQTFIRPPVTVNTSRLWLLLM